MIRFNANLFRIAAMSQSIEDTRYYLCGVYVEPHAVKGVTLTTTDGHKLLVIHDETGFADESAIINLGASIKDCKSKSRATRAVIVDGNDATIADMYGEEQTPVAKAYKVRIDGSFPDYRRVIPKSFGDAPAPAFAAIHMHCLASVGSELAAHFHDFNAKKCASAIDRKDVMRVRAEAESPAGAPSLVTWPAVPAAFAVLMPVAWKHPAELPGWFTAQTPIAQAAE